MPGEERATMTRFICSKHPSRLLIPGSDKCQRCVEELAAQCIDPRLENEELLRDLRFCAITIVEGQMLQRPTFMCRL